MWSQCKCEYEYSILTAIFVLDGLFASDNNARVAPSSKKRPAEISPGAKNGQTGNNFGIGE